MENRILHSVPIGLFSRFRNMRHQEFNTKEVLGKAMHVFWKKGYKELSLQNLLDEMGIGKSSFYATFGSKRELFLEALKHYGKTKAMVRETADLSANAPAKVAIKREGGR